MINKHLPINPYNRPNLKSSCEEIAIHYTGDKGASATRLAQYYHNVAAGMYKDKPNAWTSANYIVGYDGEIICCIPSGGVSYAVSGHNNKLINIEVCYTDDNGKFTAAAVKSLAALVQRLMRTYNIPANKVKRHFDYTGKYCPYYYVVNADKWQELHKTITGATPPKTYTLTARNLSAAQRDLLDDTLERLGVTDYTFD